KYAALGRAMTLLAQGFFGRSSLWWVGITSIVSAVIYFMFLASALWGSWTIIDLQPDSDSYLAPAAAALFEGHWFRASRPFGYSLLAYEAIKIGGSLQALVFIQLVLYVTGSLFLYTAIFLALFASLNSVLIRIRALFAAHIFAIAAVFGYFVFSTRYLASVFY